MSAMNDPYFYHRMRYAFNTYYDYHCPDIKEAAGQINNLPEMFAAINVLSNNPAADAAMITLMAVAKEFEIGEEVML